MILLALGVFAVGETEKEPCRNRCRWDGKDAQPGVTNPNQNLLFQCLNVYFSSPERAWEGSLP